MKTKLINQLINPLIMHLIFKAISTTILHINFEWLSNDLLTSGINMVFRWWPGFKPTQFGHIPLVQSFRWHLCAYVLSWFEFQLNGDPWFFLVLKLIIFGSKSRLISENLYSSILKEYFPNLLVNTFWGQIFVFQVRDLKFWLLAYFLILLSCAKFQ